MVGFPLMFKMRMSRARRLCRVVKVLPETKQVIRSSHDERDNIKIRRLVVPTQCSGGVASGLADKSAIRIGIVHAEVSNNKAELELPRIGNHTQVQGLA